MAMRDIPNLSKFVGGIGDQLQVLCLVLFQVTTSTCWYVDFVLVSIAIQC